MKKGDFGTSNAITFENCQGERASGTILSLGRNGLVFEVYNPYSIVQMSEVLRNLQIRRGERAIYNGRAVVTNLVSTGLMLIVSVSLVDPWSDVVGLSPGPVLRKEVEEFVDSWSKGNSLLTPPYKDAVTNLRHFLLELSRWLEHGETLAGIRDVNAPSDRVEGFVEDVEKVTLPRLGMLFEVFEKECGQVPRRALSAHKAFAQRELHPLLMCSPYVHRTYSKPLGYAGDYQMVNMILRNAYEGSSTFAKVINTYPLRVPTAQAHRNRIDYLQECLSREAGRIASQGKQMKVLNVGCGPAAEVERFIKMCPVAGNVRIELVDFNEPTLEFTRARIEEAVRSQRSSCQVKFVHRSIHDLLREADEREKPVLGEYDLVYCAGLFDYLSDLVCCRLLELFYAWTLPEGLVVATNVHTRAPDKGFLEHLLDWNLNLRDEAGMRELAPNLGAQEVLADSTGVNVFLEIRKVAPRGEA